MIAMNMTGGWRRGKKQTDHRCSQISQKSGNNRLRRRRGRRGERQEEILQWKGLSVVSFMQQNWESVLTIHKETRT